MEFIRAESLDQTLESLSHYGDSGVVLAGGTCTMLSLAKGEVQPKALISLDRLGGELSEIRVSESATKLGALVRIETLARDTRQLRDQEGLAAAAAQIGSWQTRTVATLGGNLCNAAPTADLLPPLLVADATVHLKSGDRGERALPLRAFLLDADKTARAGDELLTGISLAPPPSGTASSYRKVGRRGAMEVAIVGLALRVTLNESGQEVSDFRLAVSGLASTARRFPEIEATLLGRPGEGELRDAAAMLEREALPLDDVWASADYRRSVASRLLMRSGLELLSKLGRIGHAS